VTRSAAAASYLRKAERALAAARILLRENETEGACNRAYYAMFDAAHAALWIVGAREDGSTIKTHSGLIAAFGEGIVKAGEIAPEHGRALAHVLKTRLLADYTADTPGIDEARETIALAQAFLAAVRARFMA
jgi:uncharacterized protein (UPF0332 family)